ncbi:hypothetical protein AVEN_24056-1 [Araneus ventricosus]|uniref:Uncharacterized protein n=1 Tax=Araneus ventricosus TaxID=182803 RepID=A0A4Y2WWI1_ARAVE|nr:hypothetical protein AVEN_240250-1 [Araneus ventricosus]GBO40854.1 hypothetical protein AVEN_24056-1 [Araneus ventricosus]
MTALLSTEAEVLVATPVHGLLSAPSHNYTSKESECPLTYLVTTHIGILAVPSRGREPVYKNIVEHLDFLKICPESNSCNPKMVIESWTAILRRRHRKSYAAPRLMCR